MAACRNGCARAARPKTGEPPAPQPAAFRPDYRAARLRGVGDVLGNVKTQAELVLDARAAGRFTGEMPEPRAGMRSGHIPGSASLPYTDLLNADGTFRSADAVRARLAQAGVDGSRPVVTSCGSGVTACILTLGTAHRRAAGGRGLRRLVDRMGRPLRHAGGDEAEHGRYRRSVAFARRLSHAGRAGKRVHGFVNPPLLRGSTVLYPTVAERRALAARRGERVLTYGLGGSETHWALEDVIAEVEGGTRCAIVCSGLAAVTTPLLAFLKSRRSLPDAGSASTARRATSATAC